MIGTNRGTPENKGAKIATNRKKTGKSEQIGTNRADPFLPTPNWGLRFFRYRPKGVFGKGVGNSRNASEMCQKCVKMCLVLLGEEERSKMRQNCIKNASKMRGTPLGGNTFWMIPIFSDLISRLPLPTLISGLKKTRPFRILLLESVVLDWFMVTSCLFGWSFT